MARRPAAEVKKTRESILDAAEEVFSQSGYAGAATSEIAKRAGVTKSLLHHHFGSKTGLWDAVRMRQFGQYTADQIAAISRAKSGRDFLNETLHLYFKFLCDNPKYVRILGWAHAELGGAWSKDRTPQARDSIDIVVTAAVGRVRELQESGEIRRDIDPEMAFAAFVALTRHWFAVRNDYFEDQRLADERYLDTAGKILCDGMLAK